MKWKNIFELLIFTIIGYFSYFLVINYTDFSPQIAQIMYSKGALLYTVVSFNIVGFITVYVAKIIIKNTISLPTSNLYIIFHIIFFIVLFALNYSILIFAKYISHIEPIYNLSKNGWELLLTVWGIEIVIMELVLSNRTLHSNLELLKKTSKLQKENDKVKYINLQNQLNPHFLFNSLNTLIAEIPYNPDTAVQFTKHLSSIYRYILQFSDKAKVSISQELTVLNSYIYMHKVRIGDCIILQNEIPEDYLEKKIAPLSLQLLLENIFKHNAMSPRRQMVVRLYIEKEYICISNTIIQKISSESTGIGLKNLSSRSKLLTGKDIIIEKTDDLFTVKIPLIL